MKHLKVAATVVNLAILISCSSVPPSPTRSRSVPAVAVGHAMLAPHLPDAVTNGKATMMDTVGLQQRLNLAIQLPLRNQAELTRLLHDLYDPRSPNFHKYMSVSGFTERFGATAGDYNTVVAWAKANGFTVTATTPNRRLVAVEGSVDTVNRAFHVKVCNYRHPTEERPSIHRSRAHHRRIESAAAADHRHEQLCSAASDAAAQGGSGELRRLRTVRRVSAERHACGLLR